MIVGNVYKVTSRFQLTVNGIPTWHEGFYKLIGFSQANHPVFQDENRFFEASNHEIEELKQSIEEQSHD